MKSAALLCTSWARNTKLDCSWSFQATSRAVLLSPECYFGTRSGLLCVTNLVCWFSQMVPLPPFSPQGSVHSDPQCLGSWIPKPKGKGNVTTKVLIFGPGQLLVGAIFYLFFFYSSHEYFPHGKLLTCCVQGLVLSCFLSYFCFSDCGNTKF